MRNDYTTFAGRSTGRGWMDNGPAGGMVGKDPIALALAGCYHRGKNGQPALEQDMVTQRLTPRIDPQVERPSSASIVWMLSSWPGWGEVAQDSRIRMFITFAFTMLYYSKPTQYHDDRALLPN
jgi:hypothetical protein